MRENAAEAATGIAALSEKLAQADGVLAQTAQNAVSGMQEVEQMLSSCSERLGVTTDEAAANMNKMAEDYRRGLESFNQITDDSAKTADAAAAQLAAENEKMAQITNDTKSLADYFNSLMEKASEQLIEKANFAHDKIREQGENLQELGRRLEEAVAASSGSFAEAGEKLRAVVNETRDSAGQMAENVAAAGNVFKEQAETLRATADETMAKAGETMGNFSVSLEEFTARGNEIVAGTDSFNQIVKKQIELLEIGAKQAGGELAEIEKRYREMKVENFLKNATSIIEKLENLAVDINMIFNPESQDKLWQKYYEGDADVFVRYLARSMSRKQVVAIKETFEGNQEFRRVVSSYMSEFEELINRARACEKSDLLLSVISGADVGKIYYVLARALDKLN